MNNLPPCKLCKSEPERSEIINRTAFNCSNSDCSLCDAFLSKDQWIKLHGIVYQDLVEGLRKEFPNLFIDVCVIPGQKDIHFGLRKGKENEMTLLTVDLDYSVREEKRRQDRRALKEPDSE